RSPPSAQPHRRPSHQPHRRSAAALLTSLIAACGDLVQRGPSLPPTSPIAAAAAECHIEIFKPTSPNTDLTPAASDLQIAAQLP
ncbi:hypothetical protein Dimus_013940, partial [Dionaea muscipula]